MAPGIVTVTFAVAVAWIVTVFAGSSDTGEVAGTEAASEGTLFDDCAARTGVVLGMVVAGSEADLLGAIVVVENGVEWPEEM